MSDPCFQGAPRAQAVSAEDPDVLIADGDVGHCSSIKMDQTENEVVNLQQMVLTHIVKIARESRNDSSKLKRFLRRYERSPGELDDIIQDALLEATRCSDRYMARSSVETWFFGIAANVARNHVARCAKRSGQMESLDESPHVLDGQTAQRGNEAGMDVSRHVAYRQLADFVDHTLESLSPDLRGTFDLACLQEESYRDVAEIQSIPIGTVRSRVNRVRTLLRSRLKEGFADYAT